MADGSADHGSQQEPGTKQCAKHEHVTVCSPNFCPISDPKCPAVLHSQSRTNWRSQQRSMLCAAPFAIGSSNLHTHIGTDSWPNWGPQPVSKLDTNNITVIASRQRFRRRYPVSHRAHYQALFLAKNPHQCRAPCLRWDHQRSRLLVQALSQVRLQVTFPAARQQWNRQLDPPAHLL